MKTSLDNSSKASGSQNARKPNTRADLRVCVVAQPLSDGSHAHAVQIVDLRFGLMLAELDCLSEGHADALAEIFAEGIRRHTNIQL